MSEKRAKYVGHPDGATIQIPIGTEGDSVIRHIPHNGEVPTEIDGQKVPASFRDGLLEQKESWVPYNRPTGDAAKGAIAAKDDKKEGDR